MQVFEQMACAPTLVCERHRAGTPNEYQTAHWTIPDCPPPLAFEDWASLLGFASVGSGAAIEPYEFCARRLTRPECIALVRNAANKIELDPGHMQPYEKVASKYLLRLMAGIPRKHIWDAWSKLPMSNTLLKDEAFCLAMISLHPVLYGRIHPLVRNKRSVLLQALALWDLPKYSIMQFAHPNILLQTYHNVRMRPDTVCHVSQPNYWVFNDASVVTRALGKPGNRRWFELAFAGPAAVHWVVEERRKHGNSLTPLEPHLKNNSYVKKS